MTMMSGPPAQSHLDTKASVHVQASFEYEYNVSMAHGFITFFYLLNYLLHELLRTFILLFPNQIFEIETKMTRYKSYRDEARI